MKFNYVFIRDLVVAAMIGVGQYVVLANDLQPAKSNRGIQLLCVLLATILYAIFHLMKKCNSMEEMIRLSEKEKRRLNKS